eukprot:4731244-Amphidinium_carterae.1
MAHVIISREPDHLLELLQRIWLTPFGYPSTVYSDYDGGFRSTFSDHLIQHGVVHRLVPPEGHHQLGKIERGNFLLKGVLIKLADQL